MPSAEDIPEAQSSAQGSEEQASPEGVFESTPTEGANPAQSQRTTPSPEALHIIVRAESENDRQYAMETLSGLGLEPHEEWSTAYATSYRIRASDSSGARQQLEGTDLSWTLTRADSPNYLFSWLNVTGPETRQFKITDIAAEVIGGYPSEPQETDRPTVVDRAASSGQGQRIDPEGTLSDSGVRDDDGLRVSLGSYAGGGTFFYRLRITFDVEVLDFRQFSFAVTALDELYGTLASAVAVKLDTDPSIVQSPQLLSITMQSPLIIELETALASGGASIAALRVLAAVLRDPGLLGGFIPKVKTGWYDARAAQYEAQIRLEALRRIAGDVSVQVLSSNSAENEAIELQALSVENRR